MLSKAKFKQLLSLKLKKFRQKYNLFLAAGDRIIQTLLHQHNYTIRELICDEQFIDNYRHLADQMEVTPATKAQLKELSGMPAPPSVIAVVHLPGSAIDLGSVNRLVYLDNVQDPGNVGTIVRIAEWFGIDAVVRSPGSADFFSPKVVQSTMGSFAGIHLWTLAQEEWMQLLAPDVNIFAASMSGTSYKDVNPPAKYAIIIGNEGQGLSSLFTANNIQQVHIPGHPGRITESLNASTAAAILCAALADPNR